ncbi:hypothetical protein HanPI659440_Chr13g0496361 [Helianthus annuus]|nr:hypothetical protein HanPI659440_Chr13g0496361 [Helianthus annuus]
MRMLPSFFLTNNTGAPQGDTLGLMNPLSSRSWIWDINSCNSDGASRYGAFATGFAPGINSIPNSTFRSGGIPGKSSGKTSS